MYRKGSTNYYVEPNVISGQNIYQIADRQLTPGHYFVADDYPLQPQDATGWKKNGTTTAPSPAVSVTTYCTSTCEITGAWKNPSGGVSDVITDQTSFADCCTHCSGLSPRRQKWNWRDDNDKCRCKDDGSTVHASPHASWTRSTFEGV
eukprot:TRINITY_DN4039_c0_g1_i1.p1 TRINITY_DN4039_c0_g1~~TRINITY_DN4039_c0_g1_i1.p1  ORF type:complete len:148 (-),score=12.77 TRINITY_DN4039_c0_g1_i1:132-575(-)